MRPRHRKADTGIDLWIPRRAILVAALVALACAVASFSHIESVGADATYPLPEFAGREVTPDEFIVSPPEMAHVTDVSMGPDGVPVATIRADRPGHGSAVVSSPGGGGMAFELSVTPGNVVMTDGLNFDGWEATGWGIGACFAIIACAFVWGFAWLWRRAWYGHEMVAYLGGATFCLMQATEFLGVMASGRATRFSDLAVMVAGMSERVMLASVPLVAAIAAFVTVSNASLIRHEGRNPTNLLGVALGAAVTAFMLLWRLVRNMTASPAFDAIAELATNSVVATVGAYGMVMFLATCVCAWLASVHVPSLPRDYVIVLGSGIGDDGEVTPLLAGRVDAAIGLADRQRAAGLGRPVIVTSGGQGDDEPRPEGEAMCDYALRRGCPRQSVLCEAASTSTRENFSLSRAVIESDMEARGRGGTSYAVAFATTNYHVFRGYVFAHDAGLAAEGVSAPTKWYFWPNAFLREFVGFLAVRPIPIALALVAIVAIYGTIEYAVLIS